MDRHGSGSRLSISGMNASQVKIWRREMVWREAGRWIPDLLGTTEFVPYFFLRESWVSIKPLATGKGVTNGRGKWPNLPKTFIQFSLFLTGRKATIDGRGRQ